MKILLTLLMSILLIAVSTAFALKDIPNGLTVTRFIGKGIGELRFRIHTSKEGEITGIDRIEILGKTQTVQTIDLDYGDPPCDHCELLEFADLNFDGYLDLLVLTGFGTGGKSYDVWLFNKKTIAFQKSNDLSQLQNYSINIQEKEIESSSPRGASEGSKYYYKVNNGKIGMYKEVSYEVTADGKTRTITKLKSKGQWQKVSETLE